MSLSPRKRIGTTGRNEEENSHGAFIPHIRGCRQVVSISISSAWTTPAHFGIQPRNAGRQLSTSLIAAGENLAGHPHRRLIEGAISFWRAGAAQFRQSLFGCDTAFGIGPAVPGTVLVSIAANTNASDAAIGGLCTACFHAKNDVELDAVAVRMLRRLTILRCRWLDPLPTRYGNEARHLPLCH